MSKITFNCTGMILFNNTDSKAKAIAQVTVNNEFVIKGICVYEGANGPYALMPAEFVDGEFKSVIFPITAEARSELLETVIRTYNNMVASGMDRLPTGTEPHCDSESSNIFVTLDKHNGKIKAVGKAVINNSLVLTDIRVVSYTDQNGEEKTFVGLPSIKSSSGGYKDVLYIKSSAFKDKLFKAVMDAYQKMLETEFSGLTYDSLKQWGEVTKLGALSRPFAQKLAAELDEVGILYCARINSNSVIYILKDDEELVGEVRRSLTKKLIQSAA